MQIAKIHLQSVKSRTLNHNKSLLFSSSFSYYVREKRKLLLDALWNYVMLYDAVDKK